MTDLIERLQEAPEGSRALDAEIAIALRIPPKAAPSWISENFPNWRVNALGHVEVVHDDGKGGIHWSPAPYTTIIDAALKLLGEGWEYEITTLYGVAHVELPLNANDIDPQIGRRVDGDVPLALCEAIMKARGAQE